MYPASSSPSPLSLHDALPIYHLARVLPILRDVLPRLLQHCPEDDAALPLGMGLQHSFVGDEPADDVLGRSEEHTSELQSRQYLVCRLLLEKKKKIKCLYNTQ